MANVWLRGLLILVLIFGTLLGAAPAWAKKKPKKPQETVCTLQFELRSWAVFYKSGKGEGTIACDNGETLDVKLRTHGGGVQFGKNKIANGSGKFSAVKSIEQLVGKYKSVGGHGGIIKSRIGHALSKDGISLDLKGSGTGINFGFDFGSLSIVAMNTVDVRDYERWKKEGDL